MSREMGLGVVKWWAESLREGALAYYSQLTKR